MADVPEVGIDGGVPNSGTGTVQTLSTVTDRLGSTDSTAAADPAATAALNAILKGIWTTLDAMSADIGSIASTSSITQSELTEINARDETIENLTTPASVSGDIADDAADTASPGVRIAGQARSTELAAAANGDVRKLITDLVGKLIVLPYANPENFVSGVTAAMTGTTTTSLLAAPAVGLRNYITQIIVSNAHATVGTDVIIQDGAGGTTLYTIPAAAVYGGAAITFPTPLRQPTTATAIYCANVTTGASTKVSASGYKGI